MKKLFFILLLPFLFFACAEEKKDKPETEDLTRFVDPFIGTAPHGHTFPGAALPFAMVQLSPDNGTSAWDWCSGYNYEDSIIAGFSHKHLSGTGIGDLADISFLPLTLVPQEDTTAQGKNFSAKHYSTFSHENETAEPGYYSVKTDNEINSEFTVTARTGFHQYTFPANGKNVLLIDLGFTINWDKATETFIEIVGKKSIQGYRFSTGWAKKQKVFFYAEFSEAFAKSKLNEGGTYVEEKTVKGINSKAVLEFNSKKIQVKVGISSVSAENAKANLMAENPDWNFDTIRRKAKQIWQKELEKIKIKTKDEAIKRTFYTAVYHAYLAPYTYSDVNGSYKGQNEQIVKATGKTRYTIFSLWDTFRAAHPLFTITQPERINDMIKSMLEHYNERGALPIWEIEGMEAYTMIGNHAIPAIVEAYLKGYRDYDAELAYEAVKKSSMQEFRAQMIYDSLGYIPAEKQNYSVAVALEYAFDDWCVAAFAKALNKTDDYEYFLNRSKNYVNHFDKETGFMRGRNEKGDWLKPFSPRYSNHNSAPYVEANAWQYTWFVPHDVEGLINLFGTEEAFVSRLDSLFLVSSEVEGEHKSADITGLIGQYAHGNEPSHSTIYLYNYTSQPEKGQKLIHKVLTELYSDRPDGLCGNEDCGQMSAWYVWNALGFYPMNPVDLNYQFGSPIIDEAEILLPNKKTLNIKVNRKSKEYILIDKVVFNESEITENYITHKQLMQGGELVFVMK